MLDLSHDPRRAEQELRGLIFYLTTVGYIDGELDPSEDRFIRETIEQVVTNHVDQSVFGDDPAERDRLVLTYTEYFVAVFEQVQGEVTELMDETVAEAEVRQAFVASKLKQRCFELFQDLSPALQQDLIATADALLMADGEAHPAEIELREELLELLQTPIDLPFELIEIERSVTFRELEAAPHQAATHSWFSSIERPYARDAETLAAQLTDDRTLVRQASTALERLADAGEGKLDGVNNVDELAGQEPFLDGLVHVVPPAEGHRYELTVLGDLHGCYSCLKAALAQSRFFEKLTAYRRDPTSTPDPKLVLLGDYVDRGRYGLGGVLRLVLKLQASAPGHVYALRGNHEHLVDHEGIIRSAVRPAECFTNLNRFAPQALVREYQDLFEDLPCMLLFGRVLFVHGGIPRDGEVRTSYEDLASLNDPKIRFQMLWGDASMVDVIPPALQDQSCRFAYGRLQAQAFLQRLGCHTLIRGHQKVDEGVRVHYDDRVMLITVFSAGGADNRDLPLNSSYRQVRPMALTIRSGGGLDGPLEIGAWPIDYAVYNAAAVNNFYA